MVAGQEASLHDHMRQEQGKTNIKRKQCLKYSEDTGLKIKYMAGNDAPKV